MHDARRLLLRACAADARAEAARALLVPLSFAEHRWDEVLAVAGELKGLAADAVIAAYERCVDKETHWVIGPLSRADVATLAAAKPAVARPTLMLSPLGATPPVPMAVLAPDLESEAEAIAQQAGEDACRKPLVVEATGAIAARVAAAYGDSWRARNAIPLRQATLGAREQADVDVSLEHAMRHHDRRVLALDRDDVRAAGVAAAQREVLEREAHRRRAGLADVEQRGRALPVHDGRAGRAVLDPAAVVPATRERCALRVERVDLDRRGERERAAPQAIVVGLVVQAAGHDRRAELVGRRDAERRGRRRQRGERKQQQRA